MIGLAGRIAAATPVVTGVAHVRKPALKDYTPTSWLDIPSPATREGDAYHPDVADTVTGWRGYRYWMAFTPYSTADGADENPCIVASPDGIDWFVPEGLTNPIDPTPASFNSDTDILYDAWNDRMFCYWRESGGLARNRLKVSGNGVQWSRELPLELTAQRSASFTYGPDGKVHVFFSWDQTWYHCEADDPFLTNITTRQECLIDLPTGYEVWHLDVIHAYGRYYGLLFCNRTTGSGVPLANIIVGCVSDDGINWGESTDILMQEGGVWSQTYRATLQPAGDGFDVWMGGITEPVGGVQLGNRIGRTHIPLSEFT